MPPAASDEATPGGPVALVTGAYGNTGRAIADLLAARGVRVRTLTTRPPPVGTEVEAWPLDFDAPARLAAAFEGVDTFYNTYWMRTGDDSGYQRAVARSEALFGAAVAGGVQQIAHISVLNADADERYPYFRAKARVETMLRSAGVPHTVVRPALVFGGESALLNQLAQVLRRTPVFPIAGGGGYRVRPVHVDDVARLCVLSPRRIDAEPIDAIGPERPTFAELVRSVKAAVGSRTLLVPAPGRLVAMGAGLVGRVTRRQLLTDEELFSTMDGLADTDAPATGGRRLSEWLGDHGTDLGRR